MSDEINVAKIYCRNGWFGKIFKSKEDLCMSRLVSKTPLDFSFQPPPQLFRISRAMENSNHVDGIWFDRIIYTGFVKSFQNDLMHGWRGEAKSFRGLQSSLESGIDSGPEFIAQGGALFFIPRSRVIKFQAGKRRENNRAFHALRDFRRSWSSACTVSQGIPRSGCCRNSSARRSSSAICSGASSSSKSPYFSQSFLATSCCSSGGNRSICSRISVALTSSIYRIDAAAQAAVFPNKVKTRRNHRRNCP